MARDISDIIRRARSVTNKGIQSANRLAANKAAKIVHGQAAKAVAQETRIQQKVIRKRIFITKADFRKDFARVYFYTEPVPAINLLTESRINARMGRGTNKKGVKVRGYSFTGAFINRGSGGAAQVFKRKGRSRYPIERVDIEIQEVARAKINPIAQNVMRTRFPGLFEHEINRIIARGR